MNKKTYQQPQLHIVRIHQAQIICASPVTTVSSNLTGDDAQGTAIALSNSGTPGNIPLGYQYEDGDGYTASAGTLSYNGTADGITVNNYEQHSGNVSITTIGSTIDSWVWGIDANDLPPFSGSTNDLHGVDVDTDVADIRSDLGEGTLYVLGMTAVNNEQHFGFHRYTGSKMSAHKAYVFVGGSSQAPARSLTMVYIISE